ncbi:MAG: DUF1996 domain-containing protein [Actinomycetota bacterium]
MAIVVALIATLSVVIAPSVSADGDDCRVSAQTLTAAKQAYGSKCSERRADCDPYNGAWICSSQRLDESNIAAPATTPPGPCTASAQTLNQAKTAYSRACSEPRVDCDPIDGRWICSSERIENGNVVVTSSTAKPPAPQPPTTAPRPTPTTVPAPPTTKAPTTTVPPTTAPPTTAPGGNGGPLAPVPNLSNGLPSGSSGSSSLDIVNTPRVPRGDTGSRNIAEFRIDCQFSHMNFDDAIVAPGQPGKTHLHTYYGNTSVDAFTNPDTLWQTGASTCAGGRANRSAYWVPSMIDTNDGNRIIEPGKAVIYYKTGWYGGKPENVVAPPNGLRIVAGDATASGPETGGPRPAANFVCTEFQRAEPSRFTETIPTDCRPGEFVMIRVRFPQCWDGKNLDSPDHKSHMAYLVGGPNNRQECPASHPVQIPSVDINAYYLNDSPDVSGWRLSSDNYDRNLPGGYSAHGDWIAGWDPSIMDRLIQNCFRPAHDCRHNNLNDGQGLRYPG